MTMKKTVRVPVAAGGVPSVVSTAQLDKTRAWPASEAAHVAKALDEAVIQAAPRALLDDDITVPVHSSIESTLTFELLRRQSTEAEDDGKMSSDDEAGGGQKR